MNFFWSLFPTNEARRLLKKIGENSEQNSGQNSGRKFEKFGELSFCSFSDLSFWGFPEESSGRIPAEIRENSSQIAT